MAAWFLSSAFVPQRFIVFAFDVPESPPCVEGDPEIEVRQAALEDLRKLREARPSLPVEFFYDEIYGLRTCFLTFFQRKVAGITWLALPGEYNRYFDLGRREAEVFQIYVLPEFRSLPHSLSLVRLSASVRLRWLQDHGYETEYARVPATSPVWSRIVEASGYRRVGVIHQFAFLFRQAPLGSGTARAPLAGISQVSPSQPSCGIAASISSRSIVKAARSVLWTCPWTW